MANRDVSRREMLLEAGAVAIATPAGCAGTNPNMPSAPSRTNAGERTPRLPSIDVSEPTVEAIQAAIDQLATSGSTIQLTARSAYVVKKALVISSDNISLIGKGSTATRLVAGKGAVLTSPGHSDEYVLLVQRANGVSIAGLEVDMADEANSAIWIISSTSGSVVDCTLNKNKAYMGIWVIDGAGISLTGCNVYRTLAFPTQIGNDGIIVQSCTRGTVTVEDCDVAENSGAGITVESSPNVTVKNCTVVSPGTATAGAPINVNGGKRNVLVTKNRVSSKGKPQGSGILAGYGTSKDEGGRIVANIVRGFPQGVVLAPDTQAFTVRNNKLAATEQCTVNNGTGNTISDNTCSGG